MKTRGQDRRRAVICLTNTVIPLIAGLTVYLLFRPDAYIAQKIYSVIHVSPLRIEIRGWTGEIIRNHLADIMWAYAFMSFLGLILSENRKERLLSLISVSVQIVLTEVCQKTGMIPGTFDILDIIFEILAACLAMLFINRNGGRNEKTY